MSPRTRLPQRIRHETRLRRLQVRAISDLNPHYRRITLGGDDLAGFASAGYDDHIKLFFPEPHHAQPQASADGRGIAFAEDAPRPPARDYTPRRFDAGRQELVIEFALHDDGPATRWARQARVGDTVLVGGPRGSQVIDDDFDWYLLAGDETALPAIGRRLETLRAAAHVIVVAEIARLEDRFALPAHPGLSLHWAPRNGVPAGQSSALLAAVAALAAPAGDGYAWVAAESAAARAVRQHLLSHWPLPREHVKAAGYWKRGAIASHEHHDD